MHLYNEEGDTDGLFCTNPSLAFSQNFELSERNGTKMKKTISILLMLVLLFCSFSCVMPTYATYLAKQELNLAQYTMEDIVNMPKEDFLQLLADFERVYDPYNTYDTDPIMEDILDAECGEPQISPQWTSGDPTSDDEADRGTHAMLTTQAIAVLTTDKGFLYPNTGYDIAANIAAGLSIALASVLPDKDERENAFEGHFYHAINGDSWSGSTTNTALTNCRDHYDFALYYDQRNEENMFLNTIGRALHYIQDVSQPQHAANIIALNIAHKLFEDYVDDNLASYLSRIASINSSSFGSSMTYSTAASHTVEYLVKEAANKAYQYRSYVNNALNQSNWNFVAQNTVPNAVGFSALLMYKIFNAAGRTLYKV